MSKSEFHTIPDYVLDTLSADKAMPERELNQIQGIWDASSNFQYPEVDMDAKWNKFRAHIGAPMEVVQKPRRFAMFRWVAAAVVVLMVGFAVNDYIGNDPGFTAVYKTDNQKQTVQLPDGSNVILNAHSVLIVNAMNEKKRELLLKSGQAYFSVNHNKIPFVVQTVKGTISVLGTEFDIKAYKNEQFEVYLKKGKIELTFKNKPLVLVPGQILTELNNDQFTLKSITDNRAYSWLDNHLVFENTSLSEIITVLETNFKVKFVYEERLKDEKFNLNASDLNASQVADLLSKLTNSSVSIQ